MSSPSLSREIASNSNQEISALVQHNQSGIVTRLQGVSLSHHSVTVTPSSEQLNLSGHRSPESMAFACEVGKSICY